MPQPPREKPLPTPTARAEAARVARLEREARALRENLRKRKEQARQRDMPTEKPEKNPDQTEGST